MPNNSTTSDSGPLIQDELPRLLAKVFGDYSDFAKRPPPSDAKDFGAHQSACKTAIAHLEAGLKLLAWVEGGHSIPSKGKPAFARTPASSGGEAADIADLIKQAEADIAVIDASPDP